MLIPGVIASAVMHDIDLLALKNIPSPSQGQLVWVKNVYGGGAAQRWKLVYDPAGNATYPWRVDDASAGTLQSGTGGALPPTSGSWVEDTPSRFSLPCGGVWNIRMTDPGWNGVNVSAYWISNGLAVGAGAIAWIGGMEDMAYHSINLGSADISPYSSLWATKSGSGSGGINNGYWNGYPSRIIAP